MDGWSRGLGRTLLSAAAASLTSGLALALAAKAEGRGALQPLNATSHWLHGPEAAGVIEPDLAHTGVGLATHYAATLFWAGLFEALAGRRPRTPLSLVRDTTIVAATAAAVDYLATPKRFTPGWEFVLSRRAMAIAYIALGAGLVLADGRPAEGD